MTEKLLTAKHAAEILGIKLSTLYDWVYRRKISYIKIGSLLKFDPVVVQNYIDAHTRNGGF